MALLKCHECGNNVSTEAKACPSCGAPVKKQQQETSAAGGCLVIIVVVGIVGYLGYSGVFSDKGTSSSPSPSPPPPSASPARQWYEGGTLHKKTMADWRAASDEDRLATAADFVSNSAASRGTTFRSMDEMKVAAADLERQITAAGEGGDADTLAVAEVAAACMVLMDAK